MEFDYRADAVQGLNTAGIYGRLVKLFKVTDMKYATALQMIAGARLRHVVLSDHKIATALLSRNALQGAESFIPLDKIQYRVVDATDVKRVKNATGGKAELALNLIQYDERFKPAMAHIFGSTFVAEDQETAKKISMGSGATHIKKYNCMTVLGDSYRTDGLLSGGSMQIQTYLDKIDDYLSLSERINRNKVARDQAHKKLQMLDGQLETIKEAKYEKARLE